MEKILFIHVDSKPDTSVFSNLYKDIKGRIVRYFIIHEKVKLDMNFMILLILKLL